MENKRIGKRKKFPKTNKFRGQKEVGYFCRVSLQKEILLMN